MNIIKTLIGKEDLPRILRLPKNCTLFGKTFMKGRNLGSSGKKTVQSRQSTGTCMTKLMISWTMPTENWGSNAAKLCLFTNSTPRTSTASKTFTFLSIVFRSTSKNTTMPRRRKWRNNRIRPKKTTINKSRRERRAKWRNSEDLFQLRLSQSSPSQRPKIPT